MSLFKAFDAPFARSCLMAAEKAWKAAKAHPDVFAPAADSKGGGPYDDKHVDDEFYWAAAELFATNITGSFLCAREAIRRMSVRRGGKGGAIVNVSSMASRLGSPGEYVDYAASKGAIDALTIGLAKEVAAEGIRVNAVRPGVIYTEIHASGGEPGRVDRVKSAVPMQRGGQPEEVARAILWLASGEASYSTGTFIDVSGGR